MNLFLDLVTSSLLVLVFFICHKTMRPISPLNTENLSRFNLCFTAAVSVSLTRVTF